MRKFIILLTCITLISSTKAVGRDIKQKTSQNEIEYSEIAVPPTIPEVDESNYDVYYVNSSSGDDSNSGLSEGSPIKTLEKAGLIARNPNTKILLKSGQVFKGPLWLEHLSSTPDRPLIIDSYGGDTRPTIDGMGIEAAVAIRDDNVRFRNIRVTNKQGQKGISITTVVAGAFSNIEITGCRIEEVNWKGEDGLPNNPKGLNVKDICPDSSYKYSNAGISLGANTTKDIGPSWFENIYITNNEIYKVARTGIWLSTQWGRRPGTGWGYNTYISDEEGWYPAKNVVVQGNDISYTGGDAVVLVATRNSFIDSNRAFHANYLGRKGYANAGIWPHSSDNFTMQYNEVAYTHLEHGVGDGQGLDVDVACSNTVVQFNYVHHNSGGGLLLCNKRSPEGILGNHQGTIVRNNVFYDNGKVGDSYRGAFLTTSSGVMNASLYNNLIVSTDRLNDFKMVASANWAKAGMNENFTFKNNVFVATKPVKAKFDLEYIVNCKFENNLYYQLGSQTTLGDSLLLNYNPLVNIPKEFDGYENGLKFKLQEPKIFTAGLLIPGMSSEDMEGNSAEGIKYLGPFIK